MLYPQHPFSTNPPNSRLGGQYLRENYSYGQRSCNLYENIPNTPWKNFDTNSGTINCSILYVMIWCVDECDGLQADGKQWGNRQQDTWSDKYKQSIDPYLINMLTDAAYIWTICVSKQSRHRLKQWPVTSFNTEPLSDPMLYHFELHHR